MALVSRRRSALVALAFFVVSSTAFAQTAQIAGTVTDATNAVVPGATLTIVNVDTNDARVAVSNDRGQYNVPFLPSGRYTVTCELPGFQTTRREGIVLETDREVRVDFPLKPGTLTESVTVVGTPVLASETSSVGQVVTGWPGQVRAGVTTNHLSANWDMWATFAELTGAPPPQQTDGISIVPTLLGRGGQRRHDSLYWENHARGGLQAVRLGRWKGLRHDVTKRPDAPIELYDLDNDISESTNLAAAHPDVVKRIEALMKSSRTPAVLPRWNFGAPAGSR